MAILKKKTQKSLPTKPVEYPPGVFVHTPKGYYYIGSDFKRFKIVSGRCLDSWAPQRIIETSEAAVANYRVVAKLKFRNGSLIYSLADGKMYLISEGKRRHIQSPDVMERLNLKITELLYVSLDEVNMHMEGEPLK